MILFLIVSTSAVDCLERLVSEMTCYASSGILSLYTLTHSVSTQCFEMQLFAVKYLCFTVYKICEFQQAEYLSDRRLLLL